MGSIAFGALSTRLTALAIFLSCDPFSARSSVTFGADSRISPCWEPTLPGISELDATRLWLLWLMAVLELWGEGGLELKNYQTQTNPEVPGFSLSVSIAPSYSEQLSGIYDRYGCPCIGSEGSVGYLLWRMCWLWLVPARLIWWSALLPSDAVSAWDLKPSFRRTRVSPMGVELNYWSLLEMLQRIHRMNNINCWDRGIWEWWFFHRCYPRGPNSGCCCSSFELSTFL